jgi:hypothetical protein
MTDELENQLRRALRPVDAPQGFAERLMKKLPARPSEVRTPVVVALPVRAKKRRNFALPSALAASLVVAVILGQQLASQYDRERNQEREIAAGLAAKHELMQALRVTSQKLDLAYEAVNSPSQTGDEENRS